MQDAIHRTACTLKRSFKSIHSPADVFLERVSHKDMVVSPVPVIRARTREVIDSLVYVISAAGAISCGVGRWCASRLRWLLSEKHRRGSSGGNHRSKFIEIPAFSVDLHRHSPPLIRNTFTICGRVYKPPYCILKRCART